MQASIPYERRACHRVMVAGTGYLWREGRLIGRYKLRDLSQGGCLLSGGPPCEPGLVYRVVLRTPSNECVRERAWVVHQSLGADAGRWTVGVSFLDVRRDLDEPLATMLLSHASTNAGTRSGRVLIAHRDPQVRDAIRSTLQLMDYEVAEAASLSEAVWELENGPMDFHTALVSRALRGSDGNEVFRFLASMYPHVRRVLIARTPSTALRNEAPRAQFVLPELIDSIALRQVLPDTGSGARAVVPTLKHFGLELAQASSALHP